MKKIAVLGANPAWQKTLFFRELRFGEVNRSSRMAAFPSGKGINFCRAAKVWQCADGCVIQFTGGENGRLLTDALAREGVASVNIAVAGSTRCCMTCLDEKSGTMTELIEPSTAVTAAEADAALAAFTTALTGADAAAICGSLPDGSDDSLYFRAAEAAHDAGVPLVLDAWKNISPCLTRGRNILKINREELAKLSGCSDVRSGLQKIFALYQLEFAAITDGASQAYGCDGTTLFTCHIPPVTPVVNPIGCGDTASAVLSSEIAVNTPWQSALCRALGAASANCMTELPGSFDKRTALELAAAITVECGKL